MSVPAAIGVAALLTLSVGVAVVAGEWDKERYADLEVSQEVAHVPGEETKIITVAPLKKRYTPHLLIAGTKPLPEGVAVRVRRLKGVKVAEVVDGARTQVAGRQVGLLGVDPSTFRNLAPKESAKLDGLWRNVAGGDVVISFTGPALGTVVKAGASGLGASARIGAVAPIGVPGVQAIVSREQAQRLGLATGNAMVVSAPGADLKGLRTRLRKVLPKDVKVTVLPQQRSGTVQVANTARSPLSGTAGCTIHMQAVRNELDALFGPFPVIGCMRPGDPQDHGIGNATDYMLSAGGRMPTDAWMAVGDRVSNYAITNWQRLGVKYVIWRQHIWNPSVCQCWRVMGDRGSLTQNHFDHVHISVH
ncbi:hypothetical protein LO762_02730 [Actinocorallia sp. API 0066]|uniref:hypothetical protein n=1 Tax=Actinocorallia sp. API 0066 TaxID=2896846 RepID=UPI001E2C96B3|nr:hypothetical protein [Actinocorallia sp. API 0066]MCD0448116.1 hypothetical protein [Actinocorallia sp. API 0066]